MDEAAAQNVVRTSIRVIALLDQLASDLQSTLSKAAFDAERQRIGTVMGAMGDFINSAVTLHPGFAVESPDAWQKAGELDAPHWLRSMGSS